MQVGQTIGRYRLQQRIGQGGMAEIFKASERMAGGGERVVAIKRLFPRLSADREFVGMFVNEARIASEMDHPAIVRTFDLINYGSYYYIVMEYLEGMDLEDLVILRAPEGMYLSLPEVAYVVHEVAMGLHYAHHHARSGPVIHRDISPGNILLGVRGEVKITDFGIARATQYASFTRPGVLKGKYEYMAPEYVRGQDFDGRADLFSLGVVLYELLTGHNPFAGVTPHDVWNRILKHQPEPPSRLVPEVPRLMDKVVERALAKEPRRRYSSGEEFAAVLAGFFDPPGLERVRQRLGERVQAALAGAGSPGDENSALEQFLPPETERGDATREVYLDELLELVEPVEVPRPPVATGLAATVPKVPRPALKGRRRWLWLLVIPALLAAVATGWWLWPRPRGFLSVTSDLRAEIFLDGVRLGLAPIKNMPVKVGNHVIEARRPGRNQSKTYRRRIEDDQRVLLQVRWRKRRHHKARRRKRGRRGRR